jgi:crotonobetainyl-CoA:carnitine CoA-transferase CaiB-like acyl-CoA transferase
MDERDVICVPVYNHVQTFQDPQVRHNNLVMEVDHPEVGGLKLVAPPIKLSETPGWVHLPPPTLGQHTAEVLSDLGFSREEISMFKTNGVVA